MSKEEVVRRARPGFPDRLRAGELDHLTRGHVARKIKLGEQYREFHKGDVARRLGLHKNLHETVHVTNVRNVTSFRDVHRYGRHDRPIRYHGRISPRYTASCFRFRYHGPHFFAGICWYPRWAHWVSWSWHHHCHPIWDPRPIWCRPVIYVPVVSWTWYRPPVWVSLPATTSGTWVDVQPVVVEERFDLQLLAVRFVDPGHPEEKLGPRFRVWFRNNGDRPITRPFDVILFAGNDGNLTADLPRMGIRVTSIEAGDTQSVDVRLPIEVYTMGRDPQGNPAPFNMLHVLVDANREVAETSEANNGSMIRREEILPVDPAAFEVEPARAAAGDQVIIAGEGFGPQPGQLLVHLANLELEAEVLGWYDLGVRATLPKLPLAGPTEAELIVVRGDGAAANPLKITVTAPKPAPEAIIPPVFPQ